MLKGFLVTLLAGLALLAGGASVLAALPATSNYQLNSYGFGSGGTANSTTSNYTLEGITGELSGQPSSTATYADNSGFIQTQQSNVPKVTISNPSLYYDKLKFVIDQQGNPSDAKYALQISTSSNFTTGVNYVKSDNTIGGALTITDYQTYAAWGGAGGANVIGLAANTTYYLRAKATHFIANTNKITTESAYGPSTNAATVGQQLSFCLYTGASCAASSSSPVFAAAGTESASSGGNPAPAYPSGISAGDLLLLQIQTKDNATPTTPAGWTSIASAAMWGGRSTIFAKSADGTESGSLTVTSNVGAGQLAFARMYRFTGWLNDPTMTNNFEGFNTSQNSSTSITDAGVTTTAANRLAVQFVHIGNDTTVGDFTAETGGDWTEAVAEVTTTTSDDGTLQLQTAAIASAATIDGGSVTIASNPWAVHGFAILPAALKIDFGNLPPATVMSSPSNMGVDFATNANSGGNVYIYSANGGLKSAAAGNYIISSATADLSSASEGFGAQITSVGQSSGGPLNKVSPFDGASNNVGLLATSVSTILSSANPLTGGTSAIQLKAKSSNTTPAAIDYTDTLTLIAAAAF